MKLFWIILCAVAVAAALAFLVVYELGITNYRRKQKPDPDRIRVACVGDSITYGCLVALRSLNHYPAVLQRLLGDGFQVENFGISYRTVQQSADYPYRNEEEFPRSLAFKPDIVVLMLGTNDAKLSNWQSEAVFEAEYRALLSHYEALTPQPKIYLCTPAAAYAGTGAKNGVYAYEIFEDYLEITRAVVRRIAAEKQLPCIDVAAATAGHRDWYVYDGIHPNVKGAKQLAEFVHAALL